jgi:transcriptional regulator with XRE-family HTH domain
MTQTELAVALGVTFQQVQKYEKGSNRISASTLKELAETLKVPLAYFFEGLQPEGTRDEGA